MNCEKCQELLSDFFDDAVSEADRATLGAHLEECLPCFNVHAELNSVLSFCRDHRGEYDAPPNEQALWLRIRNTVEGGMFASAASQNPMRQVQRESWLARVMGRSWELSFSQMVAAVAAIVVFASLATLFGLRGLQSNSGTASTNLNSSGSQMVALTANPNGSAKVFEPKDRLWQQQQIGYWTQVVEQHKTHWNPQVRADFERNLNLLDETVNESLEKLSQHPHDDVTEEMLNSALNDKMQLLKEFSDL